MPPSIPLLPVKVSPAVRSQLALSRVQEKPPTNNAKVEVTADDAGMDISAERNVQSSF